MVNKHKQKKKKIRNCKKSNRELNALIEIKKQEKEVNRKRASAPTMKAKRFSSAWQNAWKVEKFHPLVLNEK